MLVARLRQPSITPKIMNAWTRPWRLAKTGGHVYDMEDIVMERMREVRIARMRPYVDALLNFTAEVKTIFNNLKSQEEF